MAENASALTTVFLFVVSYAVHSTLLLSTAWLLDRCLRIDSPSLRENLWKWAAVTPLLTSCAHIFWPSELPGKQICVAEAASAKRTWGRAAVAVTAFTKPVSQSPCFSGGVRAERGGRMASPPGRVSSVDAAPFDGMSVDSIGALPAISPTSLHRETQFQKDIPRAFDVSRDFPLEVAGETSSPESHVDESTLTSAETPRLPTDLSASEGAPALALPIANGSLQSPRAEGRRGPVLVQHQRAVVLASPRAVAQLKPGRFVDSFNAAKVPGQELGPGSLTVVALVCFSGLCGVLWISILSIRIWLHLSRCRPADTAVAELLEEICREHGVHRQVRLLVSPSLSEPSACGVFHWRIILPDGITSALKKAETRALLCHELGHLVRGDTVWLWAGRLLTSCFCWQPLNLLAIRSWQQASEFQCDDWAAGDPDSRLLLARVLTCVVEFRAARSFNPGVAMAAPPLSLRVERLLSRECGGDRWLSSRRQTLLRLVMLVAMGLVSATVPRLVWAAAPLRLESAVPNPAFSTASQRLTSNSDQTDKRSLLQAELSLLQSDLRTAVQLLSEQEHDAETKHKVKAILDRLDQLDGAY